MCSIRLTRRPGAVKPPARPRPAIPSKRPRRLCRLGEPATRLAQARLSLRPRPDQPREHADRGDHEIDDERKPIRPLLILLTRLAVLAHKTATNHERLTRE